MASSATRSVWYVYGIVPSAFAPMTLPSGLDDANVAIERHDGARAAALVSVLDGERYGPPALETSSGDVEWLSPRAVAHDRVLTWASDLGAVIPLPMFSLFSGREAVHSMLGERASQLEAALDRLSRGREYALRVYRVDRELLGIIASLSPRLAQLADAAKAASPGQRYLLERKLETEKKNELRVVTQQLIDEIVDALGLHAADHTRSPIPRVSAADAAESRGVMVLNAAFFVAPDAFESFQKTLTSLIERHAEHGLRFDFTGPWPPYHFASMGEEATSR
jgi:hypothetical protein